MRFSWILLHDIDRKMKFKIEQRKLKLMKATKIIIITGGVISGLGKGITASSIGLLLQYAGFKVTAIKIDPYLNVDAGTMSPYEHGECFVLDDGGEVDLDMGNYERFLGVDLPRDNNITSGKVYSSVIQNERNGIYLGKTVQIVPHITDEIKNRIKNNIEKSKADICIIEVGGVVGDIETMPFIEAIRQLWLNNAENFCFVHVSLIIDNGEPKTKPTQQSTSELRKYGINPDMLVLRSKSLLSQSILDKIFFHTNIPQSNIICNIDVPNIYYVPQTFHQQKVVDIICRCLKLPYTNPKLSDYYKIIRYFEAINLPVVNIGIAGKYTGSQDTYLSLIRALEHSSFQLQIKTNIIWIDTECVEKSDYTKCHGIIIPGGFGSRGIHGKMAIAQYCMDNQVPLFGLCLGMQIMTCQYAKSHGLNGDSIEWNPDTTNPLFVILPNQTNKYGGTMRLGSFPAKVAIPSLLHDAYSSDIIYERHRHRYEFNKVYRSILESYGLKFSGVSPDNELIEVIELPNHPFYLGCQYHPEYKSRYNQPHPLFTMFLKACMSHK